MLIIYSVLQYKANNNLTPYLLIK